MCDRRPSRRHRMVAALVVAVVLAACGAAGDGPRGADPGTGTASDAAQRDATTPSSPSASPTPARGDAPTTEPDEDDREVLSDCSPASGSSTRTVVGSDGPRPDEAVVDAALRDRPDLGQFVAALESEGVSSTDARHEAYAQVLAQQFLDDASSLAGYVEASIARATRGEPFSISFDGPVPDGFDPPVDELSSYGLEVTTGAAGVDEDLARVIFDAAQRVDLLVRNVVDDATAGTFTVEVVEATAAQVADFEAALADPERVCVVRVPPDERCDDEVVADAQERAERQGEVIAGGTESEEAAAAVARSHLGLTAEESEAKAAEEQRGWRIGAEEGVGRALTADLSPGRMTVVVCRGVVVAASIEGVDAT